MSVTVCVLGAVGALVGGWLVARWCLGLVLIAEAGCAVWWAVFAHDFPAAQQVPQQTLAEVLERARLSP